MIGYDLNLQDRQWYGIPLGCDHRPLLIIIIVSWLFYTEKPVKEIRKEKLNALTQREL